MDMRVCVWQLYWKCRPEIMREDLFVPLRQMMLLRRAFSVWAFFRIYCQSTVVCCKRFLFHLVKCANNFPYIFLKQIFFMNCLSILQSFCLLVLQYLPLVQNFYLRVRKNLSADKDFIHVFAQHNIHSVVKLNVNVLSSTTGFLCE